MDEGPSNPHPDPQDTLTAAYDQRVLQLYDARAALAGAVAALTHELSHIRAERDQARTQMREQEESFRRHIAVLEAELEAVRGLKILRWTSWPRALVYRLRTRHR